MPPRSSTFRKLRWPRRRANRRSIDWAAYAPLPPRVPGVQRFEDYPLRELLGYIDWMPFFKRLGFAGNSPTF